MLGIPLWGWIVLVVLVVLVLAVLVVRGSVKLYKSMVRQELIDYLETYHPEFDVAEQDEGYLVVRSGQGEVTVYFESLIRESVQASAYDTGGRQALYARLGQALEETMLEIDPQRDRELVMPHLVTPETLSDLAEENPEPFSLPNRPFEDTGLRMIYVLDRENSVAYLDGGGLDTLGEDEDEIYLIALSNLRRIFPVESVRKVFESSALQVVKTLDGHDAARLLLVPEHLRPGEALAAVIPDRDTLGLAPVPDDGDWSSLARLARRPVGPPLLDRPLRVTSSGFELMG